MPIDTALALVAEIARRIDEVCPRVVTPTSVLIYFDGTIELVETWAGTSEELGYVPPEQLIPTNPAPAHSGAVFGAGAILFELLTGRRAFVRPAEPETRFAVLCDVPPPASTLRPSVPDAIDAVIARALDKEADRRFATGAAMAEAIEAAATSARIGTTLPEVGRFARRLAQGVRLAHTLRSADSTPAGRPTTRMSQDDLTSLTSADPDVVAPLLDHTPLSAPIAELAPIDTQRVARPWRLRRLALFAGIAISVAVAAAWFGADSAAEASRRAPARVAPVAAAAVRDAERATDWVAVRAAYRW